MAARFPHCKVIAFLFPYSGLGKQLQVPSTVRGREGAGPSEEAEEDQSLDDGVQESTALVAG